MKITPEAIAALSKKIDGMVELEFGRQLPFVCLFYAPDIQRLAVFTNRKKTEDVEYMLEEALTAVTKDPDGFKRLEP